MEIPLFLLHSVLHTGGSLSLRVFEPRYMDMVKTCLRTASPFGVCLIAQGEEVATAAGESALPHDIGTLATITNWDMPQFGILNIVVHGGQRFRIRSRAIGANRLQSAVVELLPNPPIRPIPKDYGRLVPMLRTLIESMDEGRPPEPHHFFDAAWVADRWAELLPLPMTRRQAVLELDDGIARLDAIYQYLEAN